MFTKKLNRLKKELNLFDVFALATSATISGGLFLLPGIAAMYMGSSMYLAYLVAAIPLIPAMMSKVELATAMPRSGGVYYFLDRSLGPVLGTVGGIGIWLTLSLKSSFALVGIGAYLSIFFKDIPIVPVSISIAILLCLVNLAGAKKTGKFQIVLLIVLLSILAVFFIGGIPKINYGHFHGINKIMFSDLMSTAGLVYVSYIGISKVASISEEIKNPERNLPLGVFLALITTILIYAAGTFVLAGVIPVEKLAGNLTPVATAGEIIFGEWGAILLTVAALFSFISVANVGILSASRYPLAMSRDHILPRLFQQISKGGTPVVSILITSGFIIVLLIVLDPTKIAKLASSFQLLMFAFLSLAVIVMRESKIDSYDPGYKTPFYPWTQIFGMLASFLLIIEMGWLSMTFSGGLIILSVIWYFYYAKDKVIRNGAIYHIFERLGRNRYVALDTELRGILKEKGLRESDPFDEIVMRSHIIDLPDKSDFAEVVKPASAWISQFVEKSAMDIEKMFLQGTRIGATPVTHGIALPHLRLGGLDQAEMVIVRAKNGIHIKFKNPLTDFEEEEQDIHAVFFLVSPEKNPTQHLRILAQIAGKVEEELFEEEWKSANDEQELKESLIHEDRSLSLVVSRKSETASLIERSLRDIKFPQGCLVAMIRRRGQTIIPTGRTVLAEGDRLTIIGDPKSMKELKKEYQSSL